MKKVLAVGVGVALVTAASVFRVATQAPDGKALYNENCKKCHGVIGNPPKTMKEKYPKIASFNSEFADKHSADSIVKVLTHGKGEDMKAFKDKLKPDEMMAVAKYVRDLGVSAHPSS